MSGKLGLWLLLTLLFFRVSSSSWGSKNQLIKDPNERPIESSFQKNQWFQIWILRSVIINNQRCPKHIVHIILTYLDFVRTTNMPKTIYAGEISDNGQWVLCVEKHCLYLYDLATGNRAQTFTTPRKSAIYSCAFAKSRLFVAGGSYDKEIYLWNTNSSNLVTILSGHTKQVIDLRIFLNDTRIASASYDHTLRIWTVESTPGYCLFVLPGSVEYIMPTDNMHLVSILDDNKVQVWDGQTGKCIRTHRDNRLLDSNWISEDGRYVASLNTGDKEIKVWDIYTDENLQTVINSSSIYISDLFYLSTDRLVFGDGKKVYVWNLETGTMMYTRSPFKSYLQVNIQNISGIVERKYLIIIGKEGILRKKKLMKLYSFETGTEY